MKAAISIISASLLFSAAGLAQQAANLGAGASGGSRASVEASDGGARASQSTRLEGSGAASAASGPSSAALAGGTELDAALDQRVDTRNAEPGDEVVATVREDVESNGRVVIPKGSKLVGRVTQAQPRRRGSGSANARSTLGVVFDKAVLADGREIPVDATIQALASSRSAASAPTRSSRSAGARGFGRGAGSARAAGGGLARAGGGLAGGAAGGVGAIAGGGAIGVGAIAGGAGRAAGGAAGAASAGSRAGNAASSAAGSAASGLDAAGRLREGSRGAFGLDGLDIATAAAGGAWGSGSLITSGGRHVRLDSGTQMLLVTSAAAR